LREYGFDTESSEEEAKNCTEIQQEIDNMLKNQLLEAIKLGGLTSEDAGGIYFECMKKSNNDLKSFFAKYILMLQIELSQKNKQTGMNVRIFQFLYSNDEI
jgi:hypothetical protein